MLQRKPDESVLNLFIGNDASHGLSELKAKLALVQAACTLALEGITRATASEISMKAAREYQVEATPSFTGMIFSAMGIRTVTTHGKSKFVLESNQLEKIRSEITMKCEEIQAKLKEAVKKFQDLPKRIDSLQVEWTKLRTFRAREQELIRVINADRQNPPRMDFLEAEYKKIQLRDERISNLKQEINTLEQKEKKLASLDDKKKAIETRIADHEKKVQDLLKKEQDITLREQETEQRLSILMKRIEKIAGKIGWVDLATLTQKVEEARKELDQVLKQLGEKRSLLDKLLHRKEASS
jgi:chromosome segregation ATPase